MLTGKVTDWDGSTLTIKAVFNDNYTMLHQECREAEIRLIDSRTISSEQRKKTYALLRDISLYTGYDADQMKGVMKYAFIAKTGLPEFSLSDIDKTTARHFIDFLVEFCLEWNVPCQDSLLEKAEDIGKYLYLCLYHKKCCICGSKSETHHAEDRVGLGRNREEIVHLGMRAMALCRKHHNECHSIGQKAFNERWHIYGVNVNEVLAKRLRIGTTKEREGGIYAGDRF